MKSVTEVGLSLEAERCEDVFDLKWFSSWRVLSPVQLSWSNPTLLDWPALGKTFKTLAGAGPVKTDKPDQTFCSRELAVAQAQTGQFMLLLPHLALYFHLETFFTSSFISSLNFSGAWSWNFHSIFKKLRLINVKASSNKTQWNCLNFSSDKDMDLTKQLDQKDFRRIY